MKVEIETYNFGSSSRLVCCDFFDCALDLDEVDIFVAELDHALEYGLDLCHRSVIWL
jgi:hypothetical protein